VTGEAIGDFLPIAFGVAISRSSRSSSCSVSLRPCVASGNYDRHRQAVYVVTVLLLVLRATPIGDAIAGLT
jgi:hypothetical protein